MGNAEEEGNGTSHCFNASDCGTSALGLHFTNAAMQLPPSLRTRLRAYHPTLDPWIFGGALFGLLVVVHLYIQQGRGFEGGCTGVGVSQAAGSAFDCAAVVSSAAGTVAGVSNVILGLAFYGAIAALTLAHFLASPAQRPWTSGARTSLLLGGAGYSGYLTYIQFARLDAFCALCLASAAVVAGLLALQATALIFSPYHTDSSMTTRSFKRELVRYASLAGLAVVLIGADLTYTQSETAASDTDPEPASAAACQLDPSTDRVANEGRALVNFQDITKGASDSEVTVLEYFDPNCPHCKTFHSTMTSLVDSYGDSVQFVYKPFPLRGTSLPEIQALYVAHQQGKFAEMLNGQYARQSRQGINDQDLRAIASEIGMSPDVLMSQIDQGKYREQILQQRTAAIEAGVSSTPTVIVNGYFVQSRSAECLRTFIDRAQEGTLSKMASR